MRSWFPLSLRQCWHLKRPAALPGGPVWLLHCLNLRDHIYPGEQSAHGFADYESDREVELAADNPGAFNICKHLEPPWLVGISAVVHLMDTNIPPLKSFTKISFL